MKTLRAGAVVALIALVGVAGAANAQNAYCDRLRGDIANLDRAAASGRGVASLDAIRRQRAELDRTVAYARSIGCLRQRFLFFGQTPAQCGSIEAQIGRMESALADLESQAQRSGAPIAAQRAALAAAYEQDCRGGGQARPPGFLERLFGEPPPDDPMIMEETPPTEPVVGGRPICVRKCDGFYFPLSTGGRGADAAALCQASCPASETQLFLQPAGREADAAMALDGTPYASLPNAFRYRKAYDPSCSCRQPGQSWVEALADAERMVGPGRSDIYVNEQKSQELSRPPEPKPAPPPRPAQSPGRPATAAAGAPAAPTPRPPRPPATIPNATAAQPR